MDRICVPGHKRPRCGAWRLPADAAASLFWRITSGSAWRWLSPTSPSLSPIAQSMPQFRVHGLRICDRRHGPAFQSVRVSTSAPWSCVEVPRVRSLAVVAVRADAHAQRRGAAEKELARKS